MVSIISLFMNWKFCRNRTRSLILYHLAFGLRPSSADHEGLKMKSVLLGTKEGRPIRETQGSSGEGLHTTYNNSLALTLLPSPPNSLDQTFGPLFHRLCHPPTRPSWTPTTFCSSTTTNIVPNIPTIAIRTPLHTLLTTLNTGHIPTNLPTTRDTLPNATLNRTLPPRTFAMPARYPQMNSPPRLDWAFSTLLPCIL